MEKFFNKKLLKKKKLLIKEEEKRPTLFNNYKGEISQKEYDYRTKQSFFFLRNPLSNQIVFEIKDDSKKKRKKKFKSYFHLEHKTDTKNNSLKSINISQKKKEKNSYLNLQTRKDWLECKKIYNKCLKEYNNNELIVENKFRKDISTDNLIQNNNYRNHLNKGYAVFQGLNKPLINYKAQKGNRKKTLLGYRLTKSHIFFKNLNNKNSFNKEESNFVRCMNKSIDSNFINKGISDILKNRNLEDIQPLEGIKVISDKKIEIPKKKKKFNLSLRFERRKYSLINIQLPHLETARKMGIDFGFQYKIKSFFGISSEGENKNNTYNNKDNNDDIEIISEKEDLSMKESFIKNVNIENYEENQSEFNFFCLKNVLRLEQFHIFGLILGKGNDSIKCSRILKKILVDTFSIEKNYINKEILEKNNFNKKIDYIYFLLTFDDFKFLRDIFNSLETKLEKMGIDTEDTGATLSLIIFIKDKIISSKIGDIQPYFIYNLFDEDANSNIMVRNPHFKQNINNLFENERLEDKNIEIITNRNKTGKKSYKKILYKEDEEIQDILNNYNIKCTRMIGLNKLKKIGILNEPEIQTFAMDVEEVIKEALPTKRKNKNPHVSDSDFSSIIKKKGITFTKIILKFAILGNDELFEIINNSYYIKEINEAMIKDENDKKNKDNIKFCFNLNNSIKKLLSEASKLGRKIGNIEKCGDLSLAVVTIFED